MANRDSRELANAFEFVVVAGARARQLLRGCTPRTEGSPKPARLAELEVKQGHVRKVQVALEE
jgi:DNA-directed RNA polymerase subunit K/omega